MARFPFVSVQTLRGNYPVEPCFLDPFAVELFLDFLAGEPELSEAARRRQWRIVIFKPFLDALPPARKTLAKQLFEIEMLQVKNEETLLLDEVLSLVFRGDVGQRARAELIVLARRRQRGGKITLVSNCARLATWPNAQSYFFAPLENVRDLPVDFQLFQDLKLHRRLAGAERKWHGGEYANGVLEALNALSAECRTASGLADKDGIKLMQPAFGNQQNSAEGCVVLNDGTAESDRNERHGYRDFFHGAVRAFRNPNAHGESEGEWLRARFDDRITAAKVLCFISLLFEKLESRP